MTVKTINQRYSLQVAELDLFCHHTGTNEFELKCLNVAKTLHAEEGLQNF